MYQGVLNQLFVKFRSENCCCRIWTGQYIDFRMDSYDVVHLYSVCPISCFHVGWDLQELKYHTQLAMEYC